MATEPPFEVLVRETVQYTASGHGYYRVLVEGGEVSKHTTEREALESATNHYEDGLDVRVIHDYEVKVVKTATGKIVRVRVKTNKLQLNTPMAIVTYTSPSLGTSNPDSVPDPFSFVTQTDVALSTEIISEYITVTGTTLGAAISISGTNNPFYQIAGGNWTNVAGTIAPGQRVRVKHESSAFNGLSIVTTLTIGGVQDTFTSTTLGAQGGVELGINVSWFTNWGEDQPLANVFHQGRGVSGAIAVDQDGFPTENFDIYIYEGSTPGGGTAGVSGAAQTGVHQCRFNGIATISSGLSISNQSYNSGTNTTTFEFTMPTPQTVNLSFTNTQRTQASATNTGITNVEIMRPGTTFGDFLNPLFTQGMAPFSHFRVGPNWDNQTYEPTTPLWANRQKPAGLFRTDGGYSYGCAWEIVVKMANELNKDCWICIPAYADAAYMTNLFNLFLYGSDGVNPYTSTQVSPVWEPLNSNLAVYIEMGNEIWNVYGNPYAIAGNAYAADATADYNAGDPYDYSYGGQVEVDEIYLRQRMLGRRTQEMSQTCRSVVGDSNMMTRFRPVISGQVSWAQQGLTALSYIMCVHGGHDWLTSYSGDQYVADFPGRFDNTVPLRTVEDGRNNEFGNPAYPITHWLYGYAVAPYLGGSSPTETEAQLLAALESSKTAMEAEIFNVAVNGTGLVAMCYEGGINQVDGTGTPQEKDFDNEAQYAPLYNMFDWWFNTKGAGPFANFSLVGGAEKWGQYPDHTRQDPATYPKIRACRDIAGI